MPRFRPRPLVRSALLLAAPLLVLLGSTTSVAAECEHFTPFGQPVHWSLADDVGASAPPEWTVICHAGQVVAFNPRHNVSDWAAYRLRREDLLKPVAPRKDAFRGDPEVPEDHRVVKADYTGTGYDRGHLAPAGAMKWSVEAMRESFFMTNMAPQVGNSFNRHIWKSLEQRMRRWACERGVLYVVTGPLYEERPLEQLVYDKDGDGVDDNGVLVYASADLGAASDVTAKSVQSEAASASSPSPISPQLTSDVIAAARDAPVPWAGTASVQAGNNDTSQVGTPGRFRAGSLRSVQSVHMACSPNNCAFAQPPTGSRTRRPESTPRRGSGGSAPKLRPERRGGGGRRGDRTEHTPWVAIVEEFGVQTIPRALNAAWRRSP